jgi:prepilin-type N-terminal cleavage/methylation domain-containing protein
MLKNKKEKGFTLVEMVVVISIIGVLGAIIIPSIINYVHKANRAADKVTARLIGTTVTELLVEDVNFEKVFYGTGKNSDGKTYSEMDYAVTIDGESYWYRNVARCDGAKTCIHPNTAKQKWMLTAGKQWNQTAGNGTYDYTMNRLNSRINDVIGGDVDSMSFIPMRSSNYKHPSEDCNHDNNYLEANINAAKKKGASEEELSKIKAGTRNRDSDTTNLTVSYTDRWLIGYRLRIDPKTKKRVPDYGNVEVWAGDSHGKGDNGPRVRLWPAPPSYY